MDNSTSDAMTEEERAEKKMAKAEFEEQAKENFVTSGTLFILKFSQLINMTNATKELGSKYMQKVLHSIFFLGYIYHPVVRPEEFIPGDPEPYMDKFPRPFKEYRTHVPCQTPYSVLLEFVTEVKKPKDTESLMQELWKINQSLWKCVKTDDKNDEQTNDQPNDEPVANVFTATAVAHSVYKDVNTKQILNSAYGASLSCTGRVHRRIMINISCLNVWDRVISYAVCQKGKSPAIMFPNHVQSFAFKFVCKNSEPEEFAPCTNCMKSFLNVKFDPLNNKNDDAKWPYGNCAENECLSNLIKGCPALKSRICTQRDPQGNQMNVDEIEGTFRKAAEEQLRSELRKLLGSRKFKLKDGTLPMFHVV